MSHIISYSHVTLATIPAAAWDEAWLSFVSWKGYLQSFPGFMGMNVSARALENGDVRLHAMTTWEYPEQLEEWRDSKWSAEALIRDLRQPGYDIEEDTYEDFS